MHIKYLRHLLTTVTPHSQLHIICRCRITAITSPPTLGNNSYSIAILPPPIAYASVIHRTVTYYHLDELLQRELIDGKHAIACSVAKKHNAATPPKPETLLPPYAPWYQTICDKYFTAENLTNLIKTQGHAIFLTHWQHHQIRQRRHNPSQYKSNLTNNGSIDETISDISSVSTDGQYDDETDDDIAPSVVIVADRHHNTFDEDTPISPSITMALNTFHH